MTLTVTQIIEQEEARSRDFEKTATHKGYTVADLRELFDELADPNDWRGPIAATMPGEAVNAAVAAIEYFTATNPTVSLDQRTMRYVVTSEGYRAGPAGDH